MRHTSSTAAPLRAIGYARVSTDQQADQGVSLEAQVGKIRAMAALHDYALVDVVVDAGESAKSLDRPGLASVLAAVRARAVDVVVISKLDRLTRSTRDLADLLDLFRRRGVALVSVAESLDTESAGGRMVMGIMAVIAQWEREAISERTSAALAHKRAKGERTGNLPFGYRLAADGVRLEACPAERRTLDRLVALRASGASLAAVAGTLNAEGFTTRRGSAWSAVTVHQQLARQASARAAVAA